MNSRLAPCAYLVAFLLIAIPMFDASMSVAPWVPGDPQWRFGAIGLISNALMIPAAGMLIAVVAAMTFGHLTFLRVLRILCWIGSLGIMLAVILFALDALQTRNAIRPQMQLSYNVASLTAAFKLLLGAATFLLFARACNPEVAGPSRARKSGTPRQ